MWCLARVRLRGPVGTGAGNRALLTGVGMAGLGGSSLRTSKLFCDVKRTVLLVVLVSAFGWVFRLTVFLGGILELGCEFWQWSETFCIHPRPELLAMAVLHGPPLELAEEMVLPS